LALDPSTPGPVSVDFDGGDGFEQQEDHRNGFGYRCKRSQGVGAPGAHDRSCGPFAAVPADRRPAGPVTDANCEWDFNRDGDINTTDYSQIKLRFGFSAPECP
jgi:hypothetical protein